MQTLTKRNAHTPLKGDELKQAVDELELDVADEAFVSKFVVTDDSVDRHGDIVNPKGGDLNQYNGVWFLNHNSWGLPIGKTLKIWKHKNTIKAVEQFTLPDENPVGHMVGNLYHKGFMHDVSIGFLIKEAQLAEDRTDDYWWPADIKTWELIEISNVGVGANRNAKEEKAFWAEARKAGVDVSPFVELSERLAEEHPDEDLRTLWKRKHLGAREKEAPIISIPDWEIKVFGEAVEIKKAGELFKDEARFLVDGRKFTFSPWSTSELENLKNLLGE